MRQTITACLILLLIGCNQRKSNPLCDAITDADRDAIRAGHVARGEAVVRGDVEAAVAVVTEDVVMILPNGTVRKGREAAVEHFRNWVTNERPLAFTFEPEEIEGSGIWAFDRGTYRLQVSDTVTFTGKYLWVWRKDQDKVWRHHVATWVFDEPQQQAETKN